MSSTRSSAEPDDSLPWPSFLARPPGTNVLLCKTHRTCFTKKGLDSHLRREHDMRAWDRRGLLARPQFHHIAPTERHVEHPRDGVNVISYLPIHTGYMCHYSRCQHRSINLDSIRQHYNREHDWKLRQHDGTPWVVASFQTLFKVHRARRYFRVTIVNLLENIPFDDRERRSVASDASDPHPSGFGDRDGILGSYRRAQQGQAQRYTHVSPPTHVSEITPWLKQTGIHSHLAGIEVNDVAAAYALPSFTDDAVLRTICQSVDRVLQDTMKTLTVQGDRHGRRVSRIDARRLNTFRRAETSQDPITWLQEERTRQRYSLIWQQLVCYFDRVTTKDHLAAKLFRPTDTQRNCWSRLATSAENAVELGLEVDHPDGLPEDLERRTLDFCLSIIQQPLHGRGFDSVLVSYAAIRYWSPTSSSWMAMGNYTSILSALVYDCQMINLCLALRERSETREDLSEIIVRIRDKYQLNDVDYPMSEILQNRLLARQIARTEVPPAPVRWNEDGRSLVHDEFILSLTDVHDIVWNSLAEARRIFEQDLCLGLGQIPIFDLNDLRDNWDASGAGHSFLTDLRNQPILGPAREWLITQLVGTPHAFDKVLRTDADGQWVIDPDTVDQYERATQRFLETLVVSFFLGSGQQPRRPEFLGLRTCNSMLQKRNLFIHDGRMLFIISYHKSLNMTNASRWPARFLLPEVAVLVVQFLALIQPFRHWLHYLLDCSTTQSELLWSQDRKPWDTDRFSRIIKGAGATWIGQRITLRSWRQLTVAIAIRKFPGLSQHWFEVGDGAEEEESDASMPSVFHWQASHTPLTGNQTYGGTVNFQGGLTDAGLQQFRRASEAWHVFCRDPTGFDIQLLPNSPVRSARTVEDVRSSDMSRQASLPLVHRLGMRQVPRSRVWTTGEMRSALHQIHGPRAEFKSRQQQEALTRIIEGHREVTAILPTGGGKSLLYLLPSTLPNAGVTVVMLPLNVLKQQVQNLCQSIGLTYHMWGENLDLDPDYLRCQLLFVGIEQATHFSFQRILNQLYVTNALDRVVLDECHLALTAQFYRHHFQQLDNMRKVACQFVFLTGTLPPQMIPELCRILLLQRPIVIRAPTTRVDLEYSVRIGPTDASPTSPWTIAQIRDGTKRLDGRDRGIIYCRTRFICDSLASELGCARYYSDSDTKEGKEKAVRAWHEGSSPIMVATGAFGMGVDQPRVRLIVHVSAPDSIIDFAQETGRLGRDEQGGLSLVLLFRRIELESRQNSLSTSESIAMQRFLAEPFCRLQVMSLYLDDIDLTCRSDSPKCDRCRTRQNQRPANEFREILSHDLESTEVFEHRDDEEIGTQSSGQHRLRQRIQKQETGLQRYKNNLILFRGICMFCCIQSPAASRSFKHNMQRCPNSDTRNSYYAARRTVHGRKWFAPYAACFFCYNPQDVCSRDSNREPCEFPDIVLPACWAAFQHKGWRNSELPTLAPEAFGSPHQYMLWLGSRREIYGIRASNAMYIADNVLQILARSLESQRPFYS